MTNRRFWKILNIVTPIIIDRQMANRRAIAVDDTTGTYRMNTVSNGI